MNSKFILITILISSVLIASCTTPYDLKRTKAQISYVTKRPAKKVMECIRDSWRKHESPVYEEKTSDGWIVRHDDSLPAATVAIADIETKGEEVHVNYYHRHNRIKLPQLEEDVEACK